MLTRRNFLKGAAGLTAIGPAAFPAPALAQAKPKIVIIGGGAGGASVLRRLVAETKGALDITLVEADKTFTSCFYSNHYLGGFEPFHILQHSFDVIAKLPGVTVVHDLAKAIDREKRQVTLAGGSVLGYDRLVLSPGIALDYGSVPGWSKEAEDRMPHAWKAGQQTLLLKRQLDAVPDGGLIVVIAPQNPYRCPPGPYERVSMMAHVLKSSGRAKAHIAILDLKDKYSKQALFEQGWTKYYPDMIEWLPPTIHGGIKIVDPTTMSVETTFETYRNAALVNVIPRQTAGHIAEDAGLTEKNGYCAIEPANMKAKVDGNIFVLGDAAIADDMPKSAFAANSQAQIAAQVIATELLGAKAPEIAYRNRCWSLLSTDDSVFIGGSYRAGQAKIEQTESVLSGMDDTPEQRRKNYEETRSWYAALTSSLYR